MGKYQQIQHSFRDIGEDVYEAIHALQNNKWASEWLNHERSKEIKKSYLKLLFKSHSLCTNSLKVNTQVTSKDFDAIYDEYIEITKQLQFIEAEIKVKDFLDSLCR